jgi:enterochelin esterase-like enzyme
MLEEIAVPGGTIPAIPLTTLALIEAGPPSPARLWLDAGELESLAGPNDRLAALLVDRGWDVTYRPQHGGHNQTSWAEALIDALPAMFPAGG